MLVYNFLYIRLFLLLSLPNFRFFQCFSSLDDFFPPYFEISPPVYHFIHFGDCLVEVLDSFPWLVYMFSIWPLIFLKVYNCTFFLGYFVHVSNFGFHRGIDGDGLWLVLGSHSMFFLIIFYMSAGICFSSSFNFPSLWHWLFCFLWVFQKCICMVFRYEN